MYAFTGNLARAFLRWKVVWNCISSTSVFPIRSVFSATFRKELDNLLPQGSNLPFQYVVIYIFTNHAKTPKSSFEKMFHRWNIRRLYNLFTSPTWLSELCYIQHSNTYDIILLGSNVLKSSLLQFYRSLCESWYHSPQFLLCFLALIQQSHQESRYLSPASFQYRSLRTSSRPCRTIPKAWRAWMQLSSLML